jgi:hypothetical protein
MDWWILGIILVGVLVTIVPVLGPLIKRFGKGYTADVFRANPRTGKSYLELKDIAYYLIFGAYTLFTIQFVRDVTGGWTQEVSARQGSVVRVGGMLLLLGLLHRLNVLSLPVIGRLFSLNRYLDDGEEYPGRLEVA